MKTQGMLLTWALVVGIGASAHAQTPPATDPQTSQGPLIVERIPSGWVVSPDVAFTELNKQSGTLVGAYGGWLSDRTWLVGAGGYWLANTASDFKMAYGGLVTQYLIRSDHRIGFGIKGLVGGGDATIAASYRDIYGTSLDDRSAIMFGHGHHAGHGGPRPERPISPDTRLAFNETFFIAEPQGQVLWNLGPRVRVTFGAGYRFTASADGMVNDRLQGPIGSISVEFGGGQ